MQSKKELELGITIISVVLAFFAWLAVMTIGDPAVTKRLNGIKVNMINGSVIEELDKIYSVKNESDTISIVVRDKRSIVDRLTADDFVARADLSKWNELGNVPITVTCKNNRLSSDSYVQSSYSLQLDVEDVKSKIFPVTLRQEGEPAEGYIIETAGISPESVTIRGGESVIDSIAEVYGTVDVTGFNKSIDVTIRLSAYDIDGNEVENTRLSYTSLPKKEPYVTASITMIKTNSIPIEIQTTGKLPDGYVLDTVAVEPASVDLKGSISAISRLNSIRVKDVAFNLEGVTESFTKELDIRSHLPSGISLMNKKNNKIQVSINIKQLNRINVEIPFSKIRLKNMPQDLGFELMGTGVAVATIYGEADKLIGITATSLNAGLDLSECREEKTYQVPLTLEVPEGCYADSDNVVYVRCFGTDNTDAVEDEQLNADEEQTTDEAGGANEAQPVDTN